MNASLYDALQISCVLGRSEFATLWRINISGVEEVGWKAQNVAKIQKPIRSSERSKEKYKRSEIARKSNEEMCGNHSDADCIMGPLKT